MFAITELPAVITPSTVFVRADTTVFNPTVGGFTWARDVVDTARRRWGDPRGDGGGGVDSARVGRCRCGRRRTSTGCGRCRSGRWVRRSRWGVRPGTGSLAVRSCCSTPSSGRRCRQPCVVGAGRHRRRLPRPRLDHRSDHPCVVVGHDPVVGRFLLPVDAAALHSSGRVVTVHTATGRIAHVLPAATAQPPLATYAAGPGTEIGLLTAPTAVAVTNPGIVIVLDGGASQLAAFDLNGNPARYFGTATPAEFTLALPSGVHVARCRGGWCQQHLSVVASG